MAQKVVALRKKQQLAIGPCKSLPNSPSHSAVSAASIPAVHINQVRPASSLPVRPPTSALPRHAVYVPVCAPHPVSRLADGLKALARVSCSLRGWPGLICSPVVTSC